VDFPSYCGLLQHPEHGWMLYDTGYSGHFFAATERLPERLYRRMLPVQLPAEECLLGQLAARGLRAEDIGHIIVSHYHGDHVAGLRDFPRARYIALRADSEAALGLRGKRWQATLHGQLPDLLPEDFLDRLQYADAFPSRALPAWMAPLERGLDLFADGSLLGVPLPGHSAGQLGLYIADVQGRPVLLAADACYSLPACREGRLPPAATLWFSSSDPHAYRRTFAALGALSRREPALAILPSHCSVAREDFRHGA